MKSYKNLIQPIWEIRELAALFTVLLATAVCVVVWIEKYPSEGNRTIGGIVLGVVIGLIVRPVGEQIDRVWFGPKLSLQCNPFWIPCSGHPSEGHSLYLRVQVSNTKKRIARNCRGYLVRVREWDFGKQAFKESLFNDSLRLLAAYNVPES